MTSPNVFKHHSWFYIALTIFVAPIGVALIYLILNGIFSQDSTLLLTSTIYGALLILIYISSLSWLETAKSTAKRIIAIVILVGCSIALLIGAMIVAYDATLFVLLDTNSQYKSIDSCLDAGGKWDNDVQQCEYTNVAVPNEQ